MNDILKEIFHPLVFGCLEDEQKPILLSDHPLQKICQKNTPLGNHNNPSPKTAQRSLRMHMKDIGHFFFIILNLGLLLKEAKVKSKVPLYRKTRFFVIVIIWPYT